MEEERTNIIGRVSDLLVLFVVATDRNGIKRIISARRAERQEAQCIMKTMTLDEVKKLPSLTEEEGDVHIKIDLDLLDVLKKGGKGYQQRLNQSLRWAYENHCPYMTI